MRVDHEQNHGCRTRAEVNKNYSIKKKRKITAVSMTKHLMLQFHHRHDDETTEEKRANGKIISASKLSRENSNFHETCCNGESPET